MDPTLVLNTVDRVCAMVLHSDKTVLCPQNCPGCSDEDKANAILTRHRNGQIMCEDKLADCALEEYKRRWED